MIRCAHLQSLAVNDRQVRLLLRTADGPAQVVISCQPSVIRALQHCHVPTHGCDGVVGAMANTTRRLVEAMGGAITRVVIRSGSEPAFWVRAGNHDGWRELHLDVVSGVALIASGLVPLELVDGSPADWDVALRALTDPT